MRWRTGCWPTCASSSMTSSNGWRPPTCCNAAPATWWRWPRRTSRWSSTLRAHHRPGHRFAGGAAVGAGLPGVLQLAGGAGPAALPGLCLAVAVRGRRRIDALGDRARQALGEMSAHTADTIQGLADLTAFQATGRRRDEFLQAADRYRERRLSMQRDLSRQNANFELAAGLGGLAVAVTGGLQVAAGALSAGMLPLLVLIALATFLPVSEISQVSRQLADTIAATRRLHVVSHEPVPVNDGPADAPCRRRACRWPSSTSASPIPASATTRSGPEFHRARRRHGGRGGRVGRGQEHRGQPAAALLGSAIGRGAAGRRRPARPEAGQPARAGRAGHAGHLPVQRHAGGQHPAGPPRGQPR